MIISDTSMVTLNGTTVNAFVCTDSAARHGACTNHQKKRHKVEANDGLSMPGP